MFGIDFYLHFLKYKTETRAISKTHRHQNISLFHIHPQTCESDVMKNGKFRIETVNPGTAP